MHARDAQVSFIEDNISRNNYLFGKVIETAIAFSLRVIANNDKLA